MGPAEVIPAEDWAVYHRVIAAAREQAIPFAVGGAFGFAAYSGLWRNTKDLDLYVLPHDRERMIAVVSDCGLADYYGELPYDRRWIYRSHIKDIIVDIIWAMANHRAVVDESWIFGGAEVDIRGERLCAIAAEKVLWNKLYIVQRERCDWPDTLNLIYAHGPALDWEDVLRCLGEDAPLLAGALSMFGWLAPGRAQDLPAWLWGRLGIGRPAPGPDVDQARVDLIDSRPWFLPSLLVR